MKAISVIMMLVLLAGGIGVCSAVCGTCAAANGDCVDTTCWCKPDQGGADCAATCDGPACTAGITVCTGTAAIVTCEACPAAADCADNHGTCASKAGDVASVCRCDAGWEGVKCDADIDECLGTPCENGGICANTPGSYSCNCTGTGFEGVDCTVVINECASSPCLNGGACVDVVNGYNCTCTGDYTGVHCESGAVILTSSVLLALAAFFVISV